MTAGDASAHKPDSMAHGLKGGNTPAYAAIENSGAWCPVALWCLCKLARARTTPRLPRLVQSDCAVCAQARCVLSTATWLIVTSTGSASRAISFTTTTGICSL